MPFGNSSGPWSRRDTTTIAQRFNAGTGESCVAPVPKGRLNPSSAGRVPFRPALGRPFGTWGHLAAKPSVETLGYSRMSLRDNGRRRAKGSSRMPTYCSAVPKKLVLRSALSPGDIVLLTAAVRDLHQCHPRAFITDVRTPCPALWEHNPYLTPLAEEDPSVEVVECHYPLIDRCDTTPYHCLHGYLEFLNERLGLSIRPTAFKGDIHLSDLEKSWF